LNYLDLVFQDKTAISSSSSPLLSQSEADLVLALYAELRLREVPSIIMETWVGPLLSPGEHSDILLVGWHLTY